MIYRYVYVFVVLILLSNQTGINAQTTVFREELDGLVDITKRLLEPTLDSRELRIFRETDFRIINDLDSLSSPHANIDDGGQRIIELGTGFYRSLYAMGDLALIQHSHQYGEDVNTRWFAYAIPKILANARSPLQQRKFIKWPGDYFNISQEEMIAMHHKDTSTFTSITLGSVIMVVAHEMGHQVLGHTARRPNSLAESREWERAADEWAIKHMLAAEVMPSGGVYSLLLYYFQDQDAIAHETERTHPSEITRIKAMIQATIDNLPRFKDRFRAEGVSESEVKLNLEKGLQQIEEEIRAVQIK